MTTSPCFNDLGHALVALVEASDDRDADRFIDARTDVERLVCDFLPADALRRLCITYLPIFDTIEAKRTWNEDDARLADVLATPEAHGPAPDESPELGDDDYLDLFCGGVEVPAA